MATKAERYNSEQQLNNSRPKSKPLAHKSDRTVNAATAGVSGAGTARRNYERRSDNEGGPALEVSGPGSSVSRKSTRSSSGRVKQASSLTRRQKRRVSSPKARAERALARS